MTDEFKAAEDAAWRIHGAVVDWTGKVDSKAAFSLTANSALLGAILTLSGSHRALAHLQGKAEVFYWNGFGVTAVAALFALYVVRPRLRSKKVKAEASENFIYFGHVRHWKADDLAEALTTKAMLPVLSRQLVNMSEIAWLKHRLVQWSMTLAVVGAALEGLAALTS
jgi:hypothetical protein